MPSRIEFLERIARLSRDGQRFATATVVGRRAPVSAHLGDRAIVFPDGRMEGFIGGACAREIVRRQALDAMRAGQGRLVSIRPDAHDDVEGPERVAVRMTCASEGAVEVYVEPFAQARLLVVVGATPIASALARLARQLDYKVVHVVDEPERADLEPEAAALDIDLVTLDALDGLLRPSDSSGPGDRAVVVASQGHYDEEALTSALGGGASYVGLVASRARGAQVRSTLQERGVSGLAELHNPAGLDLGARTPSEVALSILAEIVQIAAARTEVQTQAAAPAVPAPATEIDPVCGMEVDVATARYTADLDGVTYYFCCAGCRSTFLNRPDAYLPHIS